MKPQHVLLLWSCAAACSAGPSDLDAEEAALLADPRATSAGAGRVEATVTGVESTGGKLGATLFISSTGFPTVQEEAFAAAWIPAAEGAVFVFEEVPAGEFALSVFHDLDDDDQLDKGLLGIPTEPWGVSRSARRRFGPPKFDNARLELAPGETLRIDIEVEQ